MESTRTGWAPVSQGSDLKFENFTFIKSHERIVRVLILELILQT